MQIHRSVGVMTLVTLMEADRTAARKSARIKTGTAKGARPAKQWTLQTLDPDADFRSVPATIVANDMPQVTTGHDRLMVPATGRMGRKAGG